MFNIDSISSKPFLKRFLQQLFRNPSQYLFQLS